MACLALVEEYGLVFFELAACLADFSWHAITAFGASGWSRTSACVGCTVFLSSRAFDLKKQEAMAGLVSVLGICAIPCALPLSYRS